MPCRVIQIQFEMKLEPPAPAPSPFIACLLLGSIGQKPIRRQTRLRERKITPSSPALLFTISKGCAPHLVLLEPSFTSFSGSNRARRRSHDERVLQLLTYQVCT